MTWIAATPLGVEVEHKSYNVANCGRFWNDPDAAPRITLHTTESPRGSINGVLNLWDAAEARGTLTVPHFTIDAGAKRIVQHRDLLGPACALEGCGNGSVSTNGVPNIQVEICGYAAESPTWSDDDLKFVGDWIAAVKRSGFDVPLQSSVTFYSDKNTPYILASYNSPGRLQGQTWRGYAGILGHVHVPCNAHWDPGGVDIGRILYHAIHIFHGDTNDEELSMGDISALTAKLDAVSTQVNELGSKISGWMQQERAYEGLSPIKLPDAPDQYLIVLIPGSGFAKVHLTGPAKGVLQKQQTFQSNPASFDGGHTVDYTVITDQAQIAWVKSLPTL